MVRKLKIGKDGFPISSKERDYSGLRKYLNFDNTTQNNFFDDTLVGKVIQASCDFAGDMLYNVYDSGKRLAVNFCYALSRTIQ